MTAMLIDARAFVHGLVEVVFAKEGRNGVLEAHCVRRIEPSKLALASP